ncbi:hypothetical protein [uncultured Pedobacter sp.]|uniref:hypothetical protein n=1 Tax=uncultured Pedobacter sp. TaxID=246139 RepID=UPI00261A9CBA|nr:hypothetical protein [uncultured Pedobacter sp.]
MKTIYLFLSILKGLISIGGFITIIYFIATNSKEKKNFKKIVIALTATVIGIILLTAIEFAIAT